MVFQKTPWYWLTLVCLIAHSTAIDLTWNENKAGQVVFEQDVALNEKDEINIENSDVLAKQTSILIQAPFKTNFVPTAIFDKVPQLETLALVNVGLNALRGDDYEKVQFLKKLQINENNIPVVKANSFSSAKKVEEIDLSANQITNIETEVFNDLPELKTIQLHSNKIVNVNLKDFANFPKLDYLVLSATDFQFSSPYNAVEVEETIAYNSPLTRLDLSNNVVDSPDLLKRLSIFPNLKTVYLTANRITRIDNLEALKNLLPQLSLIVADENPFDAKWLEEAKEFFKNQNDVTFKYD